MGCGIARWAHRAQQAARTGKAVVPLCHSLKRHPHSVVRQCWSPAAHLTHGHLFPGGKWRHRAAVPLFQVLGEV